jgi:hypothetical protein
LTIQRRFFSSFTSQSWWSAWAAIAAGLAALFAIADGSLPGTWQEFGLQFHSLLSLHIFE